MIRRQTLFCNERECIGRIKTNIPRLRGIFLAGAWAVKTFELQFLGRAARGDGRTAEAIVAVAVVAGTDFSTAFSNSDRAAVGGAVSDDIDRSVAAASAGAISVHPVHGGPCLLRATLVEDELIP